MQALLDFFGAQGFVPHGYCLNWSAGLLWLHVLSDVLIVAAYYSIPLTLLFFIRHRKDFPYPWLMVMFGLFIVACGTTHLLSVVTIWLPLYWLDGIVKAITAATSVVTALMMYKIIPQALLLRSPAQLEAEVQAKSQWLLKTITELKKTELALQASEQRLKLATTSGQVGIWDYNLESNELIWDDTMFALYGAQREDFSGAYDAWSSRLHPEDKIATETWLQEAIAGIREFDPEFRIILPNNEIRYIKSHATIIKDQNDKPVRLIGTNCDNYEHAYALHQLRLAHTAINKSKSAYYWLNSQGEVVDVNDYACQSLGYERAELIGQTLWRFNPDISAANWPKYWLENQKNSGQTIESQHRRKDGSTFPVEITTNYIVVNSEEYCFSFSLDISQRKQSDAALQESKNHLQTLVRTIPDLIWLKNADGVYLSCNSRFEQFFGATEDEIIGKTDYDFVNTELANAFRKYDRIAMEQATPSTNEEWVVFADDGHNELLETTKVRLCDAQGNTIGIIGIGHDITERKQAEQKLQDAYLALQQSQAMLVRQEKLAAMGTLVGGVAHEVNNPLMGIGGYITYAYENIDEGRPRDMLGKALKEVERIARIVRSMLVFGRQSDPSQQAADVQMILQNISSLIEAEYKSAEITLSTDIPKQLPPAHINIDSLQQILLNLLLNARDSVKDIDTPREVSIKATMVRQMIEIAVYDNGPGVPQEILSRIFDPFFTTKPPGSGTGLGLAVSQQMIEEVHGTLEYRPQTTGACFVLRLLLADAREKQ